MINNKNKTNYGKFLILILGIYFILFNFSLVMAADEKTAAEPDVQLQVPIFSYTKAANIAEYIKNLYKYGLYLLVPISILIILFAGIKWILAGGNMAQIKQAKNYIIAAITGLIIGLLSYVILSFIGITQLNLPGIEYIGEIESPDLDIPNSPLLEQNNSSTLNLGNLTPIPGRISCPHSGGIAALPQIAQSSLGKVTYRFGAKGGKPPYGADEKTCDGRRCSQFCPEGTICLDCSGYVNFLLKCAGLRAYSGGTHSIFGCNCNNSEKINSFTATSANGITLNPGDVVGYPTGCGSGIGHVYIYVGNGTLYESHGGGGTSEPGSGRVAGKSVKATPFGKHKWQGKCIRRAK